MRISSPTSSGRPEATRTAAAPQALPEVRIFRQTLDTIETAQDAGVVGAKTGARGNLRPDDVNLRYLRLAKRVGQVRKLPAVDLGDGFEGSGQQKAG